MDGQKSLVDYQEAIAIEVGRFFLSKGLDPADSTGATCSLVQASQLGVLFRDPDARPQKYLFGLITRKPQRAFLGIVWFSNQVRDADMQNWVFEVYGRQYVDFVRKLAKEMTSTFSVQKITVLLVEEQPRVETF